MFSGGIIICEVKWKKTVEEIWKWNGLNTDG